MNICSISFAHRAVIGTRSPKRRMARRCGIVALSLACSLLAGCASGWFSPEGSDRDRPRDIFVSMDQVAGPRDMFFRFCVGADYSAVTLRPKNLAQLALVRQELGFEYLRFHAIFHDKMGVYRYDAGKPVYDFSRVDELYDSFREIGMRPFVELGFSPRDLSSGHQTIFKWKGYTDPPKDYGKWADLVEAFVRHCSQRYGQDEVRQWYFEVWNEPNLKMFWSGSKDDYFKLYDVTAAAVKRVNSAFRVGGPATAEGAWVRDLIRHCHADHIPLDFVSTHTYAVKGCLDEDGTADTKLTHDDNAITNVVLGTRESIQRSPMPGLSMFFTEWSASYSPRDPVHDAYWSAPFILQKLKDCQGATQAMSYWTYTDLFEESGPPPTPFCGGFGLLDREGIRKPAYFAYRYLNELGDEQLQDADARSWACRHGDDFSALLWDFRQPNQNTGDRLYFRQKHPSAPLAPVALRVAGLTPGRYLFELHRTGYESNDAYSAYIDMGMPKTLSPIQLNELRSKSADTPEISRQVDIGADGVFAKSLNIRENDVLFVSLKKQ